MSIVYTRDTDNRKPSFTLRGLVEKTHVQVETESSV